MNLSLRSRAVISGMKRSISSVFFFLVIAAALSSFLIRPSPVLACVDPPQTDEDIACLQAQIGAQIEIERGIRADERARANADFQRQANTGKNTSISAILGVLSTIVGTVLPFVIGLAVLVILWGLLGYITHAGEEEKRTEARMFIVWGIVGLFIMVSIWGLVNVIGGTFRLDTTAPASGPTLPAIPGA